MKVYKRKSNFKKYFIIFQIILFISGFIYYLLLENHNLKKSYTEKKVSVSTAYEQNVDNLNENSNNNVIDNATKSVCGISKLKNTGSSILSNISESELGLGTGIIVSENGYILSNCHVTGETFSTCYVKIENKDTYTGTVEWSDKNLDLSIVKISAKGLTPITLGTSDKINLGERVYAIGNPIGYEFRKTVTSGIISGLNRTVKLEEDDNTYYMSNLIQTDSTINPGNSGGPLILENGEVIGINSVKITSAEGMGFAIPINIVKPIIQKFSESNKFEEPTLGIYAYDQSVAQYLNLSDKISSGIYVDDISNKNSDLKKGDIINKIDEIPVSTINQIKEYIYSKSPGDTVTLEITRNKTTKEIQTKLEKK